MSCLNLKGLFPTTKVLKLITKIPFKLHRLNRSKVIKKPKTRFDTTSKKASSVWPKYRAKRKKLQFNSRKRLDFLKKPAPVYIDQLFVEPVAVAKEHPQLPDTKKCLTNLKNVGNVPDQEASMAASSSMGYEDVNDRTGEGEAEADDMWEAVVLASPEMHGINERAEEFISRFRAEMKRQETLAKHL